VNSAGNSALGRVEELAGLAWAHAIEIEARDLLEKSASQLFYVACIGQHKRGKSSLIDALLREPLLPVGVLPVTSIPTIVRQGRDRAARVRLLNGEWRSIEAASLEGYVSERGNPGNVKAVAVVEVFVPNDLLENGMCFVDTPGVGSVFEANTAATREFIPRIDAAIIVLGADPPISREELSLIEMVSLGVRDLIVVLNKADRSSAAELAEAKDFTASRIQPVLERTIDVLEVSARERLDREGPERDWPALLQFLTGLSAESPRKLSHEARSRGTIRLARALLNHLNVSVDALEIPIVASETKIRALDQLIADADRLVLDLDVLLSAEQTRLLSTMREREKLFLDSAIPSATERFIQEAARAKTRGHRYRLDVMRVARDIARTLVLPWLKSEEALVRDDYRRVRNHFANVTREFLRNLSSRGVENLPDPADENLNEDDGQFQRSGFVFHEILRVAEPASPFLYVRDAITGIFGARRGIIRDGEEFLRYLLEVNASRVRGSIDERLQADRRTLYALIRTRLLAASESARAALENASAIRAQGEPALLAEIKRLRALQEETARIADAAEMEQAGRSSFP